MNSSHLKKNSIPAAQNSHSNIKQPPSQTLNTYKTVKNGNSITNSLITQLNNNVNNTLNVHNKQLFLNGRNKLISINNDNNNNINGNSNNTLITKSIFNTNKIKFNNNELSNTNTTTNNNNSGKKLPGVVQQTNKKSMSKENVNYLVSGSIAGAISRSATAGFERLTIIQQVQGMSSSLVGNQVKYVGCIPALKEMVKREGLKSIWKGNLANIVKVSPNSGIRFLTYEFCKKQFLKNPSQDKMSVPQTMASGAMAGLTSTFFTYPLDVVRIRLSLQGSMGSSDYAAQRYNGITHGFFKIHSEEGIRGLYKGLGTSVLSIIPWVSISFGAYEFFRNYFKPIIEHQIFIDNNNSNNGKNNKNNIPILNEFDKDVQLNSSFESIKDNNNNNKNLISIQQKQQQQQQPIPMTSVLESENELKKGVNMICDFVCGALSGAVTMTVCYPLDVLRRRMMVDGIGGNKLLYKNGWDAAKKILKYEGVPAFYHGIIPAYFKVVPTVAISFAVYEICKDLGGANNNQKKIKK